jgi:VanZ family protein
MASRDSFSELAPRIRKVWLFLGWMLVLLVIYLSVIPAPLELPMEQADKFSHALAYLVLMSWFANLYADHARRTAFAIGFIVMGVALEFIQRWTGYRSFEVADMVASGIGVIIGWLIAPPRLPNYLRLAERLWRS